MILLLLLLACVHDTPDPCADRHQDPWSPVMEEDVRVDESTATWMAQGDASIDPSSDACESSPCVAVTGPGGAMVALELVRGASYTVTGTVTTDVAATLQVIHQASDGSSRTLVTQDLPVGTTTLDTAFTLVVAGADVDIELALSGAGTATLDGFAVTGTRWAQSADPPAGAVHLGFLIHVEDNPNFLSDEDYWRRKAQVISGISGLLASHGAELTIQADASFVRGTVAWDPDWVAARNDEGVGWSVHIHDESEDSKGVEQAIRDGRTALREAGVIAGDLNGGFATAPWLEARLAGMQTLTAFKNPETQEGLPYVQVQPWRPADGVGADDAAAFLVDHDDGPLLYLPGYDTREVVHDRFPAAAENALSQVLAHAKPNTLNTWYYVLHVDGFGPDDPASLEAWLADGSFDAALAPYDTFLTDTDVLVDDGYVVYDTPSGMEDAWEEENPDCGYDTGE